ncbi:MAG: RDD family protein [Methanobacteriaceae archaeon]|jgi:uncharacterized RDD family membrane protein YckC|nr:RDD family protein [Methanobacteriaceae archaeon]MDO9627577.1 RDD family protein [Methanobacteriaceae archaeon]
MNIRKFLAGIVGILTFIGIIVLIGMVVNNIWPGYSPSDHPLERIVMLMFSAIIASSTYNLIKGEEIKENGKTVDNNHILETNKNNNYFLNKSKDIIENNSNLVADSPENILEEITIQKHPETKQISAKKSSEPHLQSFNQRNYQTKNCTVCQQENKKDASYCIMCGNQLIEYASLLKRLMAFIIDMTILSVLMGGLLILMAIIIPNSDTTNFDFYFMLWIIISACTSFIYFVLFNLTGQTCGKMGLKIKVVSDQNQKLNLLQSFLRTLILIVDLMPYFIPGLIALIAMASSEKNQRLGDMITKTIVIEK